MIKIILFLSFIKELKVKPNYKVAANSYKIQLEKEWSNYKAGKKEYTDLHNVWYTANTFHQTLPERYRTYLQEILNEISIFLTAEYNLKIALDAISQAPLPSAQQMQSLRKTFTKAKETIGNNSQYMQIAKKWMAYIDKTKPAEPERETILPSISDHQQPKKTRKKGQATKRENQDKKPIASLRKDLEQILIKNIEEDTNTIKSELVTYLKGKQETLAKKLDALEKIFNSLEKSTSCFGRYWNKNQKKQIKVLKMVYEELVTENFKQQTDILEKAKRSELVNEHRNRGLWAIRETKTRRNINKLGC